MNFHRRRNLAEILTIIWTLELDFLFWSDQSKRKEKKKIWPVEFLKYQSMEHRIILSLKRNCKLTGRKKFWKCFFLYQNSSENKYLNRNYEFCITEHHRKTQANKTFGKFKIPHFHQCNTGKKADINSHYWNLCWIN